MFGLFIAFFFLISQNPLLGTWEMISDAENIECPDNLRFTNANTLIFLNECYGSGPNITGTARYTIEQNYITLSNLDYLTNYQPFEVEDIQKINFEIRSDTLLLIIGSRDNRTEKYIRID